MPYPTLNLPPTQDQSSSTSNGDTKILVQASEKNQRVYNEIRAAQRSSNLSSHVAAEAEQECSRNLLRPPETAPAMARSPTTESCASSNYSGSEDPYAASPTHESSSSAAATAGDTSRNGGRRPRGKRTGHLNPETRFITAVKRRLKLVCHTHRAKKTAVSF